MKNVLTPQSIINTPVALEEFGCFVMVDAEGNPFCAPMMADGTPERDGEGLNGEGINWCDLTAPDSEAFVALMNEKLHTEFLYENFAGR